MQYLLYYCTRTGLFFVTILLAISCTNKPQGIENLDPVCFESQILPLIQNSCAVSGCHDASGGDAGYSFTNYENIMAVVKPGDAKQSTLYKVITSVYGNLMPPHQPLSMDQRNLIKIWIEQGAKNTSCTSDLKNQPVASVLKNSKR